ncbi:MAG: metallophosphoesterase family protein [Clostridia bacterium]
MLRFKKGEKFKIMQIADIQEVPNISIDTVNLLKKAIHSEKPDLVVLTGDQIKGYGISYKGKGAELEAAIKVTIDKFMEEIVALGIPFAVTFGNHDRQVGVSNKDQFEDIYAKISGFTAENVSYIDGSVNFNVEIKASEGDKTALNLYLLDSGTDQKNGYEPVYEPQLEWYKTLREKLKGENGDEYVPSMVFQHIPIFEYFDVLKQVKRTAKGAMRAYRTHKNQWYVLGDTCREGDILLEPPSIPDVNTGEFETLKEKGDVFAMYVGHDHKNSFVGTLEGIDLGFTQSAGFNEYGNGVHRGVRIFEFDEADVRKYETRTVEFKTLCGNKLDKPVKDFIFRHFPASKDAAIILARNVLGGLCVVGAAAWAITNLI